MRRLTVRTRLTGLYGGLILLAGAGLIALIYTLIRPGLRHTFENAMPATRFDVPPGTASATQTTLSPQALVAERQTLEHLVTVSVIAFAVFAVLSVTLAWWMAGRALRPVHAITATARRLSAQNLHERIQLTGPQDELKELADTFNQMLDRIEATIGAQQRFVANAAHELRTPLAIQRAAVEIGLTDPDQTERVRTEMLTVIDRSERLIDGLLLLATSDQGLHEREEVALDQVAEAVAAEYPGAVDLDMEPCPILGDQVLLTHLVRNLVANANQYGNDVTVRVRPGLLEVTNTGPVIDPDIVPQLFEPFRRLHPRSHRRGEGAGLGLSIVASIARAHQATITAKPNPGGGLRVRAGFR